jgi:molybdopterin-dependent oxidoreductase alpha subunit
MSKRLIRAPKRLRRDLWVSPKPYGLGETKPNAYREIARTVWDNKRAPVRAWRILTKGVCDGCALGVAGLHDWTIEGVHLCSTRLGLLKLNAMGPLDHGLLADVSQLERHDGAELRDLGRLAQPMLRKAGEPGFKRIGWDEALDLIADRIRATDPERIGFYLTARGLTNEVYYVAQKAARLIGTPNIDNAARVCHAPSTAALKEAIGVGATTVSYRDVIESDLVVLFGSNVANAQPVFMKYLYLARKRNGTRVAVVNPLREPGLERYWVPSNVESALFGTRMTDEFFGVNTGGDVAFINGVLKLMIERGLVDERFIAQHGAGFDELTASLHEQSFDRLEQLSGASRDDMERFAQMYADARSAAFVWSMGITQHENGSDNVRAIVNLALARGSVGRAGSGLMPIRGHSGVQGGAEMGAYATALPGGLPLDEANATALSERYGFQVPSQPGLSAPQLLDGALAGEIDVLYSSGGNFIDVLPDPDRSREALSQVLLRVHQDIVVSSQMLVEPSVPEGAVLLLPAATRYEQDGGCTETTTERRIVFSPKIVSPPGEARSEWRIFQEVAQRARPERAHLIAFEGGDAIRQEVAEVVPFYAGVEHLKRTGDQVQWGGKRLCEGWCFATGDGRAHFAAVAPRELALEPDEFLLSSRRGKQFNSMVLGRRDPLTGAARDALFIGGEDAERLGLAEGDAVRARSQSGELRLRVRIAPMRPGNVQVHFPEANVLIDPGVSDPVSGVPDYNAIVELAPAQ